MGVSNPGEKICPDDHHLYLIGLRLPSGTLWSCCNVDVDKPEAYVGYYAWGETEEKQYYLEENYKYYQDEGTSNMVWDSCKS